MNDVPTTLAGSIYHTPADNILHRPLTDKCIVLDLDSTLISTQDHIADLHRLGILTDPAYMNIRNRIYQFTLGDVGQDGGFHPGNGNTYRYWGISRPHLREFLLFCFSYFKIVAVWTAGKKNYGETIVDIIFKDIFPPHVVFTQDDTVFDMGLPHKPLVTMIQSHPLLVNTMTLQNIFALDDNINTFVYNPGNGIHIPAYDPKPTIEDIMRDDDALPRLQQWLMSPAVIRATDVTLLDKNGIF